MHQMVSQLSRQRFSGRYQKQITNVNIVARNILVELSEIIFQ